jgi:hypothetical protein
MIIATPAAIGDARANIAPDDGSLRPYKLSGST